MSDVENRFSALLGRPPSDAELARFSRIQNALGIHENDALWSVIIATQLLSDQKQAEQPKTRLDLKWILVVVFGVSLGAAFCVGRMTDKTPGPTTAEITAAVKSALAEHDSAGKQITLRIGERVFDGKVQGDLRLPAGEGSIEPAEK